MVIYEHGHESLKSLCVFVYDYEHYTAEVIKQLSEESESVKFKDKILQDFSFSKNFSRKGKC